MSVARDDPGCNLPRDELDQEILPEATPAEFETNDHIVELEAEQSKINSEPIEARRDRLDVLLRAQEAREAIREQLIAKYGGRTDEYYKIKEWWYRRIRKLKRAIQQVPLLATARVVEERIRLFGMMIRTIGKAEAEQFEVDRASVLDLFDLALDIPRYVEQYLRTNVEVIDLDQERESLCAFQVSLLKILREASTQEELDYVRNACRVVYDEVEYREKQASLLRDRIRPPLRRSYENELGQIIFFRQTGPPQ